MRIALLSAMFIIWSIPLFSQESGNFRKMDAGAASKANEIILKALEAREQNDPENVLESYKFKSYSKIFIDRQPDDDTASSSKPAFLNRGKHFLSEKISSHFFKAPGFQKEEIEGLTTAGFNNPTYEVLTLNLQAPSLYKNTYTLYQTTYAGPLGAAALRNYDYSIIDTLNNERPAYVISFKPRNNRNVAGVEGVLHLDTLSFAIQEAHISLSGAIELEAHHYYNYYEDYELWFPQNQQVVFKPGTGEEDIAIFGGGITLGTVQRKKSLLYTLLPTEEIEENLQLTATSTFFEIQLNTPVDISPFAPGIQILEDAGSKSVNYWAQYRQEPFTLEDELSAMRVSHVLQTQGIERQIEIKDAIMDGYFPLAFWNFEISRFGRLNVYEGIRLGFGGETNSNFSENYRIRGYWAYSFGDDAFKYGVGGGKLLNSRTRTWWNVFYNDDIREIANHTYLRQAKDFAVLRPRIANINYHYDFRSLETSLEHRITPRLGSELQLSHTNVSQIRGYAFEHNGNLYRDYTLAEATASLLWQPFSKYLSTPQDLTIYERGYPIITGQLTQSFSNFMGGDFNFTKLSVKADYLIQRLDRSISQVMVEGNIGFGDLPLTHAFHASPNNPNQESLLQRFSVAGFSTFETMFFNEFFSDRQAALLLRHQFRPFQISNNFAPQLVLLSRHVIGDFRNPQVHHNIQFKTLEHGYNEAGMELNQIFLGLGLSAAYRYGAYHLPTFKENISVKFTLLLEI